MDMFLWLIIVLTVHAAASDSNKTSPGAVYTTMNICSIIERGNPLLIANYDRIGPAIDLALEVVHEYILPENIKFALLYKNGGTVCAPKSATIGRLMEWTAMNVKCNLFLGPGCSEAVLDLYQAAEHDNIVLMGIPGAHTSSRAGLPRSSFPNLIRTTYTFVDLGNAVRKFMDLFNYQHITIIINTESYFYQEMGDNFRNQYRTTRQNLRKITSFVDFTHDQMPSNWTSDMLYADLLRNANSTSRVIFLMANSTVVRNIMVTAYQLGMAAGQHVFFCVELFRSEIWGDFTWEKGDIHDYEARNAFQSLLVISMAEVIAPQLDEFTRLLRHRALRDFNYTFSPFERIDVVTLAYVEAVFLFATAVKRISDGKGDYRDTATLLGKLRNTSVESGLGDNITIAITGDRVILYDIKTFDLTSYTAHPVFRMDFVRSTFTNFKPWTWPDGNGGYVKNLPPDVPPCGFLGLDCHAVEKDSLVVTASVIPIVLLIFAASAVAFIYRKMQKDQNPYWWRFYTKDLEFPENRRATSSVGSSYTMNTKNTGAMTNTRLATISPWKSAILQSNQVIAYPLDKETYHVTEGLILDMKMLRYMRHHNMHRFIGLCLDDHSWITHVVGEMCSKGCLQDILENMSFKLDWSFKFSFLKDIAQGLAYLHASPIHSHGFLTSINCLVDGRFLVKLAECGLAKFHRQSEREPPSPNGSVDSRDYQNLLWRAPEQLRVTMSEKGSQKGDVYSFAVIMQQIILRSSPYTQANTHEFRTNRDAKDLLLEIKRGVIPPVRPPVPRSACSVELYDLMERCWSEFPMDRPAMAKVQETVRKISGLSGDNVIDLLLTRMEDYSQDLESQITEKNLMLIQERQRLDEFASHLMPRSVAERMAKGDADQPQVCSSVSGYCAKLNTTFQKTSLTASVHMLNDVLDLFDHFVGMHQTAWRPLVAVGSYMVVCGLPGLKSEETNHAVAIARIAVELKEQFSLIASVTEEVTFQAGIHSGPCVTGIIGMRPPRYCLFGDCVLTAGRLKHSALPGTTVISEATRNLIIKEHNTLFQLEIRTQKTDTDTATYWLNGVNVVEFV